MLFTLLSFTLLPTACHKPRNAREGNETVEGKINFKCGSGNLWPRGRDEKEIFREFHFFPSCRKIIKLTTQAAINTSYRLER